MSIGDVNITFQGHLAVFTGIIQVVETLEEAKEDNVSKTKDGINDTSIIFVVNNVAN